MICFWIQQQLSETNLWTMMTDLIFYDVFISSVVTDESWTAEGRNQALSFHQIKIPLIDFMIW